MAASTFLADPGADAAVVIDDLKTDRRMDSDLISVLSACHLDGTLYNAGLE